MKAELEVTEEVSKGRRVLLPLSIETLAAVYNSERQLIGSATIEGLSVELHLDRNQPEALNLEVQPERLKATVKVSLVVGGGGDGSDLRASIVLEAI